VNGTLFTHCDISAGTGAVSLTAGGADKMLSIFGAITGASVALTADRMELSNQVIGGTGAGSVIALQPYTAGRLINLGSAFNATSNTLELADFELDRLTAGVLRVGSTAAGNLTVTAAITQAGASYGALSLVSGGTVSESPSGQLAVTNLAVKGGAGRALNATANAVSRLAGGSAGGSFAYSGTGPVAVTGLDGQDGIHAAGAVSLTVAGPLTVARPVTTANADIVLTADRMTL